MAFRMVAASTLPHLDFASIATGFFDGFQAIRRELMSSPSRLLKHPFKGINRFYLPLDQQLFNDNFAQFVVITRDLKAREDLKQRLEA